MAISWIKMRTDLLTHPKVVRIASALGADKLRAIGGLHAVWSVFDTHSEDGVLEGYTLAAMDDAIGWPGFSEQMVAIGWLLTDGYSLMVPRFDEHNGQSAKRRATETQRKREARASADGPQDAGEVSAADADKTRSREDKRDISSSLRSEDKRVPALTVADLITEGLTPDTAAEWLAHRKRKKAPLTPRAWEGIKAEALKAGWTNEQAVLKALARGWTGFEAEWVRGEQQGRAAPAGKHSGFDGIDYREGIAKDGSFR